MNGKKIVLMIRKMSLMFTLLAAVIVMLVGIGLLFIDSPIWNDIGSSTIAGGIVGLFSIVGIVKYMEDTNDMDFINAMKELGINGYIHERSLDNTEYKKLADSSKEYDLIGFGLGRFRKAMRYKIKDWVSKKTLRILVINPSSEISSQRDREEKDQVGKISQDVLSITKDLVKIEYELKKVTPIIKWYNAVPGMNIQRFGSVMFLGPYFVGKKSTESLALRIEKKDSILFDLFKSHFDELWKNKDLTIDPSFISVYPELLDISNKYWDKRMYYVIGSSCSGKSTALEIASKLGYACIEWSDVLQEYCSNKGIDFSEENIRGEIKENGVHFFPYKIIEKLVGEFVKNQGGIKGYMISGSRNIEEVKCITNFFRADLSSAILINASDKVRYERHCSRNREHSNINNFIQTDKTNIVNMIKESVHFIELKQITIENEDIALNVFKQKIEGVLKDV